jgi:hypothetical protein
VSANGGLNWYDSLAACAALGASAGAVRATLASVRDPAQLDAVMNKVCAGLVPLDATSRRQSVWIGLWNDPYAGSLAFVSGTDAQYFLSTNPWNVGEPNFGVEHCTQMPAGRVALNDTVCSLAKIPTVGNQQMAGCCEAPVQPVNACPPGFVGPNPSGFCYRGVNSTSGHFWDGAFVTCRNLGNDSTLAAIVDSATADSVVTQRCAGTLPAHVTAFWTGIQDTTAQMGHTNRSASYWRNYGSGHSNDWFISQGQALWAAGQPSGSTVLMENCVAAETATGSTLLYDEVCSYGTLVSSGAPVSACCHAPGFYLPPTPSTSATASSTASRSITVSGSSSASQSATPSGSVSASTSASTSGSPSASRTMAGSAVSDCVEAAPRQCFGSSAQQMAQLQPLVCQ